MKDLFLRPHLGLGDAIICNGLVRHFARFEPNRMIILPAKTHNVPSVRWMFSDLELVTVKPVKDDWHADRMAEEYGDDGAEVMYIGGSGNAFDEEFYCNAGVPMNERWSGFHVPPFKEQHRVPPYPFRFVHDDGRRGFIIRDDPFCSLPAVRPVYDPESPNIFAWQNALQSADVIHCIPSSFFVLMDSLLTIKEQQLFLHASARPGGELPTYRKPWKIV